MSQPVEMPPWVVKEILWAAHDVFLRYGFEELLKPILLELEKPAPSWERIQRLIHEAQTRHRSEPDAYCLVRLEDRMSALFE